MYLNVELELANFVIKKCLVLLYAYLGPNTKKLRPHTHHARIFFLMVWLKLKQGFKDMTMNFKLFFPYFFNSFNNW